MDNWDRFGHGAGYNSYGEGIMYIMMFLILLALISIVVVALMRGRLSQYSHRVIAEQSALEQLNLRYAKGEMTQDEFKTIKKDIS